MTSLSEIFDEDNGVRWWMYLSFYRGTDNWKLIVILNEVLQQDGGKMTGEN